MNNTDLTPVPKVAAAGVTGAATILLVWILGMLGVEVPAEAASAITALLAFGAGYFAPRQGS